MIKSYNFLQLFDERGKCPAFDSMANKLYIQLNNHSTDTNITTLMSYLSENCGQPINFKNLIKLYDLFICQACIKHTFIY